MTYSRKNLLNRIVKIQEITISMKEKGATQEWIYENMIKDNYFISKSTYKNYLAINAKKELKELNKSENETI